MTKLLFRDDAYQRECQAQLLEVADDHVLLDQTVCYALGGGQPGDCGLLTTADGATRPITDTRYRDDGEVAHFVTADGLQVGDSVTIGLDWSRRFAHMRMHSCLHLLGSLLKYPVTGGSISALKGRLDFDMSDPVDKPQLATQLNELINQDHPVTERWITDEELAAHPELVRTMSVKPPIGQGRVRLLDIEGIDLQPCGGTHVRRTSEIGAVSIGKVEKKGRQNRRVNVVFD